MAEVSATYVKSVLATLPVGYYLGTRAEVSFSETSPTSYCLPLTNQIVVSYNNVKAAMATIDEADPAKIEEFTRGCLYHEVSHLILTPKTMEHTNPRNIFEDERIESRLRSYYRDVNFREMILKISHWTPDWKPVDAEGFFFGIMRYHTGPKDLVEEGMNMIRKYMGISTMTCSYDARNYFWDIDAFYDKCAKRFGEQKAAEEAAKNAAKSEAGDNGDNGSEGGDNGKDDEEEAGDNGGSDGAEDNEAKDDSNGSGSGNESKDEAPEEEENGEDAPEAGSDEAGNDENGSEENGGETAEDAEDESSLGGPTPAGLGGDGEGENSADNGSEDEAEAPEAEDEDSLLEKAAKEMDEAGEGEYGEIPVMTTEEVHDLVKKVMTAYDDPKIMAELHRIIIRSCKKRANRAGSSIGYTGKVDPRMVGMRRDYRWFVRGGNDNNKFDRVHLTLWVDCSGSFSRDIHEVNKLMASLNAVEKMIPGMFCFDVVSMNRENKEHSKKEPCVACGGNSFGPDIVELSRKLTKAGWSNYNVAVWDGDMCSNMYGAAPEKVKRWLPAFRVFDNSKSVIVTDSSNHKYLEKACKNARLTYITGDYATEFVAEVLKLLDRML